MLATLMSNTSSPIVEGLEVTRLDDALDLIGACYEHSAHSVVLEARSLPKDFFDLSTRFAGEFIQKLVNYRLRVAGVFPDDEAYTERFREYVREAGKGPQFRTFATRAEALVWLAS